MKKWIFSMESVLQLRIRAEDKASMELAAATRKLTAAEISISDVQSKIAVLAEYRMMGQNLIASEHLKQGAYWVQLQVQLTEAIANRDAALANVERAQKSLLIAQRERKSVEKLKENEELQHATHLLKLEQAEADEMSTARFVNPT